MIIDAVYTSIKVVLISLIITLGISIVAIKILTRKTTKFKKIIETLIILPMFIPPSAIGYLILIICGKNGPIGKILNENFNTSIIFTLSAAVIAAVIVTLPIMYQSIKVAVLSVDEDVKDAARAGGASEFKVFTKITLPLSRRGILTGILLSFSRAFGEFGATILVAGNIPGKTQTLPMSMYYAIENNNNKEAVTILIIVFIIAVFLMSLYSYLINKED